MKKLIRFLTIVTFITGSVMVISLISGCTFSNEEDYFKLKEDTTTCDTSQIVYGDLTYIFTDICASCHNSVSTPRQGIVMDTYGNVKNSFATGKVLPAIKHEGSYKMPKNRAKLSDCEIQKIEAWVKAGMPLE